MKIIAIITFAGISYIAADFGTLFGIAEMIARLLLGREPRIPSAVNIIFEFILMPVGIFGTYFGLSADVSRFKVLEKYRQYLLNKIELSLGPNVFEIPTEIFGNKSKLILASIVFIIQTFLVTVFSLGFSLILDLLAVSLLPITLTYIVTLLALILGLLGFTEIEYIAFFNDHTIFIGKNWILKIPNRLIKEFYYVKAIGMRTGLIGVTLFYALRVNINGDEMELGRFYYHISGLVDEISKRFKIKGIKRYHYRGHIEEYWADLSEVIK